MKGLRASIADRVITLAQMAGVTIDGPAPGDIRINDERAYSLIVAQGSVGLGESYMAGFWDCDDLEIFFEKIFAANLERHVTEGNQVAWVRFLGRLFNVQTPSNTRKMADTHYNISNELFEAMLGPTMAYSCAYWKDADNLDAAQMAKYDLVCRKLKITERDNVLDVGCGWGGFAKYAAETYGCSVTGVTVASEQADYAIKKCEGLPVTILCCDYRKMSRYLGDTIFTKIASIGMFEHVGYRNYRLFMKLVAKHLTDDGLFLLHTIGCHRTLKFASSPWIEKYIFPSSMLPSLVHITRAAEDIMIIEDMQDIGFNYHRTLMAWHARFEDYWHNQTLRHTLPKVSGSTETFYRMWRFYLISTATSFKLRRTSVWQLILSKEGVEGGYIGPR